MLLKFDRALTRMDVHAQGPELAMIMGLDRDDQGRRVYTYPEDRTLHVTTFADPVLITDNHKIASLEDPTLRDTVFSLYGTKVRWTEYDGTALRFAQSEYPGVWGPSIDTLLVCRALHALGLDGVRHAVEIGAGSGFITKYLLAQHEGLERATLVDMSATAIKACQDAVKDPRARFYTGDGQEFLASARADLVLCNPPYIPRPRSIDDNAYEGVGLLVDLIERAPEYLNPGGRLLLNISSLCRGIAMDAIARSAVTARTVDTMEVPLKVFNVLNNDAWRSHLIEHCALEVERRDGYDHWHTIEVLSITP